jgi:hypothetical protein
LSNCRCHAPSASISRFRVGQETDFRPRSSTVLWRWSSDPCRSHELSHFGPGAVVVYRAAANLTAGSLSSSATRPEMLMFVLLCPWIKTLMIFGSDPMAS